MLDLVALIVGFIIWPNMLPCSVLYHNLVIVWLNLITLQHKYREDPRASLFLTSKTFSTSLKKELNYHVPLTAISSNHAEFSSRRQDLVLMAKKKCWTTALVIVPHSGPKLVPAPAMTNAPPAESPLPSRSFSNTSLLSQLVKWPASSTSGSDCSEIFFWMCLMLSFSCFFGQKSCICVRQAVRCTAHILSILFLIEGRWFCHRTLNGQLSDLYRLVFQLHWHYARCRWTRQR